MNRRPLPESARAAGILPASCRQAAGAQLAVALLLVVALPLCSGTPAGAAEAPFPFKEQETIVFFGDSITSAGLFTEYVESCLVTRFPEKDFRVFNAGRNSETLSGTTETNHPGPRPNGLDRFTRDVAALHPTLVVACYGMNDGNYAPLDEGRFGKFKEGVNQFIARVREETKARLIILTPPPFDSRTAGHPDVRPPQAYGYKAPFANYDDVLTAYSDWLLSRAAPDVTVIDLHAHLKDYLRQRRRTEPRFTVQPDQIHPDATGHMIMAATLLKAWHVPAVASAAVVDVKAMKVIEGRVARLSRTNNLIEFYWSANLPMPSDDHWDAQAVAFEDLAPLLNQHRLSIRGLAPGNYRLFADEEVVANLSDQELAQGVDLHTLKHFPTEIRSRRAWTLIEDRRKLERTARQKIAPGAAKGYEPNDDWSSLTIRLKLMCRPRPVRIRLLPENP